MPAAVSKSNGEANVFVPRQSCLSDEVGAPSARSSRSLMLLASGNHVSVKVETNILAGLRIEYRSRGKT